MFEAEMKKEHDHKRKKLLFFEGISAFVSHGLVMLIIIVLWESTTILNHNLSICTFPWIRSNISVICANVIALSALNCVLSYVYYKS